MCCSASLQGYITSCLKKYVNSVNKLLQSEVFKLTSIKSVLSIKCLTRQPQTSPHKTEMRFYSHKEKVYVFLCLLELVSRRCNEFE